MVRNREGVLYEGSITSLTSHNSKGKFDVLSLHSNLISLVDEKLVIKDSEGQITELEVKEGVLRVVENHIEVYLGFLD